MCIQPVFSEFFGVANVNSIFSLKITTVFRAAESRVALCFSQFFSTRLFKHFFQVKIAVKKMIRATPDCANWRAGGRICNWSYWLSISSSTAVILCSMRYCVHAWFAVAVLRSEQFKLPLRNRSSAMYFFVAKLLSIAVMTYSCV